MVESSLAPNSNGEEELLAFNVIEAYQHNVEEINAYVSQALGTSQYLLQSEDIEELFDSMNSDDFWDDLLSAPVFVEQNDNTPPVMTESKRIRHIEDALLTHAAEDAVRGIQEESRSFRSLVRDGEVPVVEEAEALAEELAHRIIPLSEKALGQFMRDDDFWKEIIVMQDEAQSSSSSSFSTPQSSVKMSSEKATCGSEKSGSELDNEPQTGPILQTSTVWDDLEVVALNPHKMVELNKVTVSEDNALAQLADEINTRANRGPNIKYSFVLCFLAALSVALVSVSNSVQESPRLFRVLWILAFMINVITVSMPGRLDRVLVEGSHVKPWSSLFEASTWAFSIWGLIYLSETLLSGYVGILGIPMRLFQRIVPYWLAGNWCQGLWCFAFRPEFKDQLWIPTVLLTLGMVAFGAAHFEITAFLNAWSPTMTTSKAAMLLFRVPFAMHTSWLAAAAALNLNSYVALRGSSKGVQIAVAHMCAYVAFLLGLYGSISRNDPVISLTIAWALEAVSTRSVEKMHLPRNLVGPDVYESLALTEGMLSNAMKCVSLGIIVAPFVA